MSAFRMHRPAFPEGCLFQANLGSFTGYYGPQVQARAYELLKVSAYTAIASDLHDGSSGGQLLHRDKLEFNPLLKKLTEWDGLTGLPAGPGAESGREAVQEELF